MLIIKNKFNTKDRGATKSAEPIATFATIVNPALACWSSKNVAFQERFLF